MIIRPAAEADRATLAAMLCRCSEQSRYRRFHSVVRRFPEPYFTEALKGTGHHYALVAQIPADTIVAMASCVTETDGTAEIGILVEDAWQRQGIGTRLLDTLMAHAAECGIPRMRAMLLPEHKLLSPLLRHRNIEPVITTFGLASSATPAAVASVHAAGGRPASRQLTRSRGAQ